MWSGHRRTSHPAADPSRRPVPRPFRRASAAGLAALASLVAAFLPAGCGRAPAREAGPTEITVWHPWGSDQGKALRRLADRFEAAHPGIRVRLVYTPTDLSTNQKFFTAIAANKPPDVSFVDGTQDAQWAEWGALMPLDDFIARDGIRPDDYYAPCWNQAVYDGSVWSLTYGADPNFVFCWNKDAFRRAGLDPERPPRTIAELDRMAEALTVERDGRLVSLGIVPWGQYGAANSVFTWGWAFGGSFYNEEARRITANDPEVVEALDWMVSYARRLGVTRINSAAAGWGAGATDPFFTGQLAMRAFHITSIKDIEKYAPDLDFGMAPMPGKPDGEIGSSWIGGWSVALPRGCKNPEEGWRFIRWISATPEGTLAVYEETGTLPGYRRSPAIDRVKKHPRLHVFVEILETSKHQRPTMPAQAYYMGALDRAVDRALYGKMTPKQALDQATIDTQRELDLILKGS